MKTKKLIQWLESAKRSRSGNFRERFEVCPRHYVTCHSKDQYDWWEQFCGGLRKGEIKPHEFSIQDLFFESVKDGREMCQTFFDPRDPGSGSHSEIMEAAGAVTSSDFSNITGAVIYSRMMENLKQEDMIFQNVIPTQPTRFNGEKIPGLTGLGDVAEVVPENHEFPLVGFGEDWQETPQTDKRGMIVPVTKEAIFFDRTGQILEVAGSVGDALRLNKEKRAIDCMIDENTTTHRYNWRGTTYATYQTATPWDNVTASNALVDWTDLDATEQTFNAIVDPNTGEPVSVEFDTIWLALGLRATADRIVNATSISVVTPGYATSGNPTVTTRNNPVSRYNVLSSRLLAARLATDTDWFVGNPRRAFIYMENWPITVTQAPTNSYDDFRRDIVYQAKASERGVYYTMNPRLVGKATVA